MLVGSPETLHDDIVDPAPFAVHTYFDVLLENCFFPVSGCVLTSLIELRNEGVGSILGDGGVLVDCMGCGSGIGAGQVGACRQSASVGK